VLQFEPPPPLPLLEASSSPSPPIETSTAKAAHKGLASHFAFA
jgi:hypothetical protein